MVNRIAVVFCLSLAIFSTWSNAGNLLTLDPFFLVECPATISARPNLWHLVYAGNESLVFRHSDDKFDDVMAVVKAARQKGRYVQVNRSKLVQRITHRRHSFAIAESAFDFVCDECKISEVLTVSKQPLEYKFIQVYSASLAFFRKAHRLSFSSDELWNFNYNGESHPIWITKRVADHLRKTLPTSDTLQLNSVAFLDPNLKDDHNSLLEDLPLEQLVQVPKQ